MRNPSLHFISWGYACCYCWMQLSLVCSHELRYSKTPAQGRNYRETEEAVASPVFDLMNNLLGCTQASAIVSCKARARLCYIQHNGVATVEPGRACALPKICANINALNFTCTCTHNHLLNCTAQCTAAPRVVIMNDQPADR